MKKILLYAFCFILLCFLIPIVFTKKVYEKQVVAIIENKIESDNQNEKENTEEQINLEESTYDYKEYKIVKVLHTKTNVVEEIPLDEYLYGVVSAEMPANFEMEALKAQGVVARTYTIYKIQNNNGKHEGADICDDSNCCQAWISKEDRLARWEESLRQDNWNKIRYAVNGTQGKIITYDGKPINAFFHSNSGGKTESTINVWGGTGYPYLQTVETVGEDAYTQYSSEVTYTKQTFIDKMKEKYQDFQINFEDENCIKILEYTDGNRVKKIKIGNIELSGVEVRSILGLKSANFIIDIDDDNIKISVTGYGHGVGMSQTGADAKAKQGSSYEEIIKHFYTGVEIVNL